MKVVLILVLIAAILVLISLIRIGVQVVYVPSGLTLRLKLGPVRLKLLPRTGKKQPKKEKKRARRASAPEKSRGDMLSQVRRVLPLVTEGAGRLKRKVRLDRIYLDVTAAASDPASAALEFGGVNAVVGMIWPLVEQNFNVRDRRIRTRVDFTTGRPSVNLDAAATLTVGQALALALWLAPKLPQALGTEKQTKKQTDTQQKEAV